MDSFMGKSDDEMIGYLEDQGAIVWDGVADNGEAVFKFNLDKLKEILPEMYEEIMADIDNDLMKLYDQGFVEIEYDEDLNALFRPTQKGAEWAKKMGFPEFPFPN
jgi:hypothetical protein